MDADRTKVSATSTKITPPQSNSWQWQQHLETIWAQPQHSSTEHPVSAPAHLSPSNPWTLDTTSTHFRKGLERSKEKQIFLQTETHPFSPPSGCHLPEALNSIWALLATFPWVLITLGKIAQQQWGTSTHLSRGEETPSRSRRIIGDAAVTHDTRRGSDRCEKGLARWQEVSAQSYCRKTTLYTPEALSRDLSSRSQVNTREKKKRRWLQDDISLCSWGRKERTCMWNANVPVHGSTLVHSSSHCVI